MLYERLIQHVSIHFFWRMQYSIVRLFFGGCVLVTDTNLDYIINRYGVWFLFLFLFLVFCYRNACISIKLFGVYHDDYIVLFSLSCKNSIIFSWEYLCCFHETRQEQVITTRSITFFYFLCISTFHQIRIYTVRHKI